MTSKGKKKKGQAMSLGEFLGEETAQTTQVVRDWAEEMENEEYDDTTSKGPLLIDRSMLPTAPKAALGPQIDLELVPKQRPFIAYLSNISYEGDERQLRAFFKNLKVESINLPTNERGTGIRGFGHVEFSDRESLIEALGKNDMKFMNRQLRVQLNQESSGGGGGGFGGGGDGYGRRDRDRGYNHNNYQQQTFKSDESEWRRRPSASEESEFNNNSQKYHNNNYPPSETGSYRGRGGGFNRGVNRGSGGGGGGGGGYSSQNRVQNINNNGSRPYNQNMNTSRSSNRSSHQSSPNEERYQSQRRAYQTPQQSEEQSVLVPEAPMERPKLVLQPRTKPIETERAPVVATSSSIFGGAKPVDTSARERAIEEKLQTLSIKPQKEETESVLEEQSTYELNLKDTKDYQQQEEHVKQEPDTRTKYQTHKQLNRVHQDDDGDSHSVASSGRRFSNQSREFVNSNRTKRELVEAPPPQVNAWQKAPVALFSDTNSINNQRESEDTYKPRVIRNSNDRTNERSGSDRFQNSNPIGSSSSSSSNRPSGSTSSGPRRYESDRRPNFNRNDFNSTLNNNGAKRQSFGGKEERRVTNRPQSQQQQQQQQQSYQEAPRDNFNSGNKFATLDETDDI